MNNHLENLDYGEEIEEAENAEFLAQPEIEHLEDDFNQVLNALITTPHFEEISADNLTAITDRHNLATELIDSYNNVLESTAGETPETSILELSILDKISEIEIALKDFKIIALNQTLDQFNQETSVPYRIKIQYTESLENLIESGYLDDLTEEERSFYTTEFNELWVRPTLTDNSEELRAELREIMFYDLENWQRLDINEVFLAINYTEGEITEEELQEYRQIFEEMGQSDSEIEERFNDEFAVLHNISQETGRYVPSQNNIIGLLNEEDPHGNCEAITQFALSRINLTWGVNYSTEVQIYASDEEHPGHIRLLVNIDGTRYAINGGQVEVVTEEDLEGTVTSEARSYFVRRYLGEITSTQLHGRETYIEEDQETYEEDLGRTDIIGQALLSTQPVRVFEGSIEEETEQPERMSYAETLLMQRIRERHPDYTEEVINRFREYTEELQIAEENENDEEIASLLTDIGDIYSWYYINSVALDYYNRAIELNPHPSDLFYYSRSEINNRLGNYEAALEDANRYIESNPDSVIGYAERATTYYLAHRDEEALNDINRTLSIDPNYNKAYYLRGLIHEHNNEFDQAILNYERAIEVSTLANPDWAWEYPYLKLYSLYQEHPELGSAEEIAERFEQEFGEPIEFE